MKIVICGSIEFTKEIKKAEDTLKARGYMVEIPTTSNLIIKEKLTVAEYRNDSVRESAARKIKDDVIRDYYQKIKKADAILVVNVKKKGINGYIGGNTFLEMGFAHVLNKKIYLYNSVPRMSYIDEILAMKPIVINGDLLKIK